MIRDPNYLYLIHNNLLATKKYLYASFSRIVLADSHVNPVGLGIGAGISMTLDTVVIDAGVLGVLEGARSVVFALMVLGFFITKSLRF